MLNMDEAKFEKLMRQAIEELAEAESALSVQEQLDQFVVNTLKVGFTAAEKDIPHQVIVQGLQLSMELFRDLVKKAKAAANDISTLEAMWNGSETIQ